MKNFDELSALVCKQFVLHEKKKNGGAFIHEGGRRREVRGQGRLHWWVKMEVPGGQKDPGPQERHKPASR